MSSQTTSQRGGARPAWHAGVVLAIGCVVLAQSGCAVWRLPQARRIAETAQAYTQQPSAPSRRLVVLGDSTAVGTGADDPRLSVAGRIGQAHPDWRIDNFAVNGAKVSDVPEQLTLAGSGLDMVLIMVGGNDVIRLSSWDPLQATLLALVARAQQGGARVVLMPCGDVGRAPLFLPPFSSWLNHRSTTLHAVFDAVGRSTGVPVVDLRVPRAQDPFVQAPDQYHAADGLHPTDAGYGVWFDKLKSANVLR